MTNKELAAKIVALVYEANMVIWQSQIEAVLDAEFPDRAVKAAGK